MSERDHGPQRLSTLIDAWGLTNHQLVEASTEQLTHKQVRKAREGRQLTLHLMMKVTRAFNVAIWNRLNNEQKEAFYEYQHNDLFSYAKKYQRDWLDPNTELITAASEK